MEFKEFLAQYEFVIKWVNELGSIMVLTYGSDGSLSGTYKSGVGATEVFDVAGRWDTRPSQNRSYAVGWSVVWANSNHSIDLDEVTSWSGHHVLDASSRSYVIKTTWLLTQDTVINNDWKSKMVGQDTLTQTQ